MHLDLRFYVGISIHHVDQDLSASSLSISKARYATTTILYDPMKNTFRRDVISVGASIRIII